MSRFALLSRTYGFTPEQIGKLTVEQFNAYLSGVVVNKDDPLLKYETQELSPEEEANIRALGLKVPNGN